MGPQRKLIHLFPRHPVLVGHEVGGDPLLDDLVLLEEFRAQGPAVGPEGHAGHRFHAPGDHDVRLVRHDFHRCEVERLQARGAHAVHARPRNGLRESRDQRREAPDVHALFVDLRDAAKDDILDELRLHAGAVDEGPEGERGQIVRPPVLQGAAALPDGGANGLDDDGVSHGRVSGQDH